MTRDEDTLPILETECLILRRRSSADMPSLVELWSDPEVTRYLGGPRDVDQLVTSFAETAADLFAEEYDVWPVIERSRGRVVGHCGLMAWGKGYATEMAFAIRRWAAAVEGLTRLVSLIERGNVASERAAIKLGVYSEREVVRTRGHLRRVYVTEPPR